MRLSQVPGPLASRGRRIGLLGGSFNPAHDGHLYVSLTALRRLQLDEVWWLVSPQNPLKSSAEMAPLEHRLALAAASAAGHRQIRVTSLEVELATRFAVDTMAALRRTRPTARFVWLIGADNLAQMPRWHRWQDLLRLVPLAVFSRQTYDLRALAGPAAKRFAAFRIPLRAAPLLAAMPPPAWVFFPIRRHPASATAIRAARLDR